MMRLITLNIWGGRVREPFLEFIQRHKDTDIFCFQELYNGAREKLSDDEKPGTNTEVYSDLKKLLPNHSSFFRPVIGDVYGIGAFVKNDIDVLAEGEVSIHTNTKYPHNTGHHSRNMEWLDIKKGDKTYSVLNVHGLWNGAGKTDTPDRLTQSERIKAFMDTLRNPKILCGDFNLLPHTESMRIIEQGMNNLVKIHNVPTTRTSFYTKPEKFADYILTSPEINVHHFEVLPDEVSDHSALLLDFD